MRKVNILWMYDDLLDLYGDWGNLLAIEKGLDAMGIEHETHKKSIGDAVDFAAYDLVYMGPGKARNLEKAAEDLLSRKEEVLSAIESGKLFLVTGNSRLAFGRSFETYSGTTAEGLGLFSCTGTETGNVFISDVLAELAFEKGTESYGFINRTAHLEGDCGEPLFLVKKGAGDGEGESPTKRAVCTKTSSAPGRWVRCWSKTPPCSKSCCAAWRARTTRTSAVRHRSWRCALPWSR